jgi:EF hand
LTDVPCADAGAERRYLLLAEIEAVFYGRKPKEYDMNTLTKVAALAAVLSVSAAFAQDDPATQPSAQSSEQSADYSKLDVNGDGNISMDEAKADPTLSAKFNDLDKDGSGSLSTTELSAAKSEEK